MQCFWNYLSNSVAKRSFMGSFEFKFYILWALASVAMFPVLQWRWSYDELMSEIVPQLAYGGEVLITAMLGIRSNFRFKRIIAYSMRTKSSTSTAIVNRLSYFKEMNIILTCVLFIYGACFVILCADGLTEGKTINTNKFACDLLIANVNMCVIVLWLLFISIFHPRRNLSTPQNSAISRSGQESEFQSKNDVELTQNSRPLSQRITNFIHNNSVGNGSAYGSEKYQQQSSPISSQQQDTYGNGVFMRPMSPVNVDYPPSMGNEAAPLTSAAAATSVYQRNMSIEDPYSSQSVVFSMVDPPPPSTRHQVNHAISENQQSRYPTPTTDMSYHTTTATGAEYPMHSVGMRDQHDARSEFDVSDYHDDTTQPAGAHEQQQPPRMVTDWLYQSPERKQ
ncbi:hypothetical protein LRAMOSA06107 [Lichtheimia ramosa]|uniref:Uncharacterized protein n=1 Tax=Lichtheimia ramosa TaxID=688394 RepID=A0A077X387_9FUNG|nr:hypothetical protein LRAMOSA06107 [Lichtheimia ramosa]